MSDVVRDARYFEQMKRQSNSRFVSKKTPTILSLVIIDTARGVPVTVCKPARRPKKGYTVCKKLKEA
jgi:hypothetical protein